LVDLSQAKVCAAVEEHFQSLRIPLKTRDQYLTQCCAKVYRKPQLFSDLIVSLHSAETLNLVALLHGRLPATKEHHTGSEHFCHGRKKFRRLSRVAAILFAAVNKEKPFTHSFAYAGHN
jgi:hypothetical protein